MIRKLDRGLRRVWELSIVNVLRSADCNQSGFNGSQTASKTRQYIYLGIVVGFAKDEHICTYKP